MTSNSNTSGIVIDVNTASVRDVVGVLGRVSKSVFRSTTGLVSFSDVFNCMADMKHAIGETYPNASYIPNEGFTTIELKPDNISGLVRFMIRASEGYIDGLTVTQSESESLKILVSVMRANDGHLNNLDS